ncbi:hypothetical protein PILCRDRAFT_827994 [Piloderma croceum F 1598]|uniref:Uncharacterized protein n=1 Tax=Piloderma croceum (strain F 1598) TaxID=765440 RepID=A0A0C3F477_PILCF|nr:hypothetical protein PILCRDRAFT_827994 [Piloderma croceum F 1598]
MDTDWCLSCGLHVASDALYCSPECLSRAHDRPSVSSPTHMSTPKNISSLYTLSDTDSDADAVYHDIQDASLRHRDSDDAGIRAWAANIPHGASDGTASSDSSGGSSRATSPPPRRTPKLLLFNRRPAAASLCMSTPHPQFPPPSKPIVAPSPSIASLKLVKSAGDVGSSTSSGITDSVVATPSSAGVGNHISQQDPKYHTPHVLDALAIHVRSWVSPLPQPQPKCTPLTRAAKPPAFTLGPRVVLHGDSDQSVSDDLPAHDAWWVSEESNVENDCRVVKRKTSQITRPRGQYLECDHPAYRARGRKISRAIS